MDVNQIMTNDLFVLGLLQKVLNNLTVLSPLVFHGFALGWLLVCIQFENGLVRRKEMKQLKFGANGNWLFK